MITGVKGSLEMRELEERKGHRVNVWLDKRIVIDAEEVVEV